VIPLGSAVTGLMVWRDVDYGVDARGISGRDAWATMRPLVERERCAAVRYENETGKRNRWSPEDERHYFVARIESAAGHDWKVDVSLWVAAIPPAVEPFQERLRAELDDELRLVILRLKDAWKDEDAYPEVVSAFEIYDAVLDHGVRTLAGLDEYLVERGLPART